MHVLASPRCETLSPLNPSRVTTCCCFGRSDFFLLNLKQGEILTHTHRLNASGVLFAFGCRSSWLIPMLSLVVAAHLAIGTRSDGHQRPLCHDSFRALEECLGHDHSRLQTSCRQHDALLHDCLKQEWKSLDSAGAYAKPPNAFNRLKPCRHGLMLYNPLDWYIGRSLEVYGEWAEKKVKLWALFIQEGDVSIDVGAHVGTLTLPLAKLVGVSGRVLAFEPFSPSFTALAANVALNSLENVELQRKVLAHKTGRMQMNRGILAFQQHDFFNYGSMDFHGLDISDLDSGPVKGRGSNSTSLWDNYEVMKLDSLALPRLDFLKVDAEEMEPEVLRGAQKLLGEFKPLIFVEYRNPKQRKSKLLQFMKKMHYECVLVRLPIFNEQNFRMHQEDIWNSGRGSIVNFNLFCKSTRRDYPHLGDVSVLFTSSVETDVAGLRSTPLPDPFEVMAKYGKRSSVKGREKREMKKTISKSSIVGVGSPAPTVDPPFSRNRVEEMSLDELLDMVDPPKVSSEAGPSSVSNDSMTFEELLEFKKEVKEPKVAHIPETTLDEL